MKYFTKVDIVTMITFFSIVAAFASQLFLFYWTILNIVLSIICAVGFWRINKRDLAIMWMLTIVFLSLSLSRYY